MPRKTHHIILCCGANGRGVVYGEVSKKPVPGEPVTLRNARMVLRWSTACGGLFGLAAMGPRGQPTDTRITHAVAETTETVWREYIVVSPAAAQQFAAWSPVA